ncbi:hypothetical protein [Pseudomonas fluorescens group sp. PF-69]
MQITCWASKFTRVLFFLLLGSGLVSHAHAGTETFWAKNNSGQVHLSMTDGTAYDVKLLPSVDGVFYDKRKHELGEIEYVSLFQVSPSNAGNPLGLCGAGNEIWLHVYRITGTALTEITRTLVSSCLHSISMTSQNSGTAMQDQDFSSVQWNLQGFSIEWFEQRDAAGRSLQFSNFVLHDGVFLQQDVVSQEHSNQ